MIEKAFVLPFMLGGLIGSAFGSCMACTMWFFDSMDVVEALELAKSRGAAPLEKKRVIIYKGRVRHMGYGLDIVEVRI